MRLLCDNELAAAVRGMFKGRSTLRCAVAFWGPELGALARRRKAEVVLDISMGGTSRNALKAMGVRKTGMPDDVPRDVRVLDGLHAKIYLGADMAIVGSANASGNALGRKGGKPRLREAGVLIERRSDPEAFADVEAAWERYVGASRPVRPDDLDRAVRVSVSAASRDWNPSDDPMVPSVLDALIRRPEDFADTAFIFADSIMGKDDIAVGDAAYEDARGSTPKDDGRTHVCLVGASDADDRTVRRSSQVVTYWFGPAPGLYAYHDIVRVEHDDASISYFGRAHWPTVRKAMAFPKLGKADVWREDRETARSLSKIPDEPKGERFVVMSHSTLYEAIENVRAKRR